MISAGWKCRRNEWRNAVPPNPPVLDPWRQGCVTGVPADSKGLRVAPVFGIGDRPRRYAFVIFHARGHSCRNLHGSGRSWRGSNGPACAACRLGRATCRPGHMAASPARLHTPGSMHPRAEVSNSCQHAGERPHSKARRVKPDARPRPRERTRWPARRGRRGAEPRPCPGCRDGSVAAKRNDACCKCGALMWDRWDKTMAGEACSPRPRQRQSRSADADALIDGNRGFLGPVGRRGSRRRV